MLQNATPLGKSAPWPPNISDEAVSCTAPAQNVADPLLKPIRLSQLPQKPHILLTFGKVQNPLRLPRKTTLECPTVVRMWCASNILTSKCASRHNTVHFFDIWTSKSGPRPSVFNTVGLQMCFVPKRRALFEQLNFQKCSGREVFWHFRSFWLPHVLRATAACTFSTCQFDFQTSFDYHFHYHDWLCVWM